MLIALSCSWWVGDDVSYVAVVDMTDEQVLELCRRRAEFSMHEKDDPRISRHTYRDDLTVYALTDDEDEEFVDDLMERNTIPLTTVPGTWKPVRVEDVLVHVSEPGVWWRFRRHDVEHLYETVLLPAKAGS